MIWIVRVRWIKRSNFCRQKFCQRRNIRANPFHHAPRQFVAAVVVVMRTVLKCFVEIFAHSAIQHLAHRVQINQRHALLLCHVTHCLRVIRQRVAFDAALALHRSHQHRSRTALARLLNDLLQVGFVNCECVRRLILHVIVAELNEQPIVRLHRAKNFFKTFRAE